MGETFFDKVYPVIDLQRLNQLSSSLPRDKISLVPSPSYKMDHSLELIVHGTTSVHNPSKFDFDISRTRWT